MYPETYELDPANSLPAHAWGYVIKYGGGEAGGFYKLFNENFVSQETIDLNISWPSNLFGKYFKAPNINFSFSVKAYL